MPVKKQVLTEIHYTEIVRPARCRNDRWRENVMHLDMTLDVYTEEEAPVALIVKHYNSHYNGETDESVYECAETPYRLVNGKLYTSKGTVHGDTCLRVVDNGYSTCCSEIKDPDEEDFELKAITKDLPNLDERPYGMAMHPEKEYMLEVFEAEQSACVMIGDTLWRESPEPAYNTIGGGWGNSSWAVSRIAYQPKDETEYRYNANEWDKVVDRINKNSSNGKVLDHEDKIEVLIPEAVSLPSSSELSDMKAYVRAIKHLSSASMEIGSISTADSDIIHEEKLRIKRDLKALLEALAQRKQRGYGMLTEEQLEAATDSAYNDLMSRTKLIDY